MDNESLDKFIDNNNNSLNSGEDVVIKPKLRKIKRPKPKIAPTSPVAPQKVTPEEIQSYTSKEDDINYSSSLNNEEPSQNQTSLVTMSDASEIAPNEYDNSYILEGLPPELDYVTDEALDDEGYYDGYVKKKLLFIASFVCLLVGVFVGKALFSSQKIEKHGLEGVVINQDVPSGRPRCGLTDKSQACVFYLMNWYKQELNGRDFYKLTAQLTGREEYMIETDNLRYANVKIKPGHFAQLNVPALK